MVMPMPSVPDRLRGHPRVLVRARAATSKATKAAPTRRLASAADDQLEQLRFLHEVARLATTARTWDELLETVVDRTRDVLHADVSSLYLLDRDGAYLTLAATNGLDRFQIGRARVPFARRRDRPGRRRPRAAGHHGRPGRPALPVGPRHRPAPLRVVDAVRAADLARPDGRRPQRPDRGDADVQRPRRRAARRGRGPARRDHREGPPADRGRGAGRGAQGDRRGPQRAHRARHPRAPDAARDRPRLRGPARGRAAAARARIARHGAARDAGRPGIARRSSRSSGSTASSTPSWPRCASCRRVRRRSPRSTSVPSSTEVVGVAQARSSSSIRSRSCRASGSTPSPTRRGSARSSSTSSRTRSSTRRPGPPSGSTGRSTRASSGSASPTRGRASPTNGASGSSSRTRAATPTPRRGSGIGLYAAKRLGESMGAHLWCEPARPHGARFVVAHAGRRGRLNRLERGP